MTKSLLPTSTPGATCAMCRHNNKPGVIATWTLHLQGEHALCVKCASAAAHKHGIPCAMNPKGEVMKP